MTDKKLSHYEIADLIGKGGMGEVYRARDTKLGRDVAIKILPAQLSGDTEREARFEREARTLASLQHPNVASIYGYETDGDVRFLVMELVEGEDVSERLERGAIPVEEVVDLARQLAEGMAAAHAVGIAHRDLKPANIKVDADGKLKILDFGLARAYAGDEGTDSDPTNSPTITAMTQAGVILGTAAYMSPEQARGKRADHRADIWAFGVVLFEMLTGTRLFEGETVSDTLAGVLRAEVPWDTLPKDTPPTLRRLLERCLERDPSRRLQAIAEARIALEDMKAGRSDESIVITAPDAGKRPGRERLVWIVAVVALAAALVGTSLLRKSAPEAPLTQSTLSPPFGWDFSPGSPFAVSPEGRRVAFVAVARPDNEEVPPGTNRMFIQDLSETDPQELAGTDGSAYPFWSPDGRWLGFRSEGKLNKIEARGGPAIPICDATTQGRGATWNEDGTIVFQREWSEGLMRVPAAGGAAEPLTTLNKDRFDVAHRWPTFLPDGRRFLYYVVSTTNTLNSEHSGVYVGSLDSDESKFLLRSESRAVYASGHLLYRLGTTLMAQPFDASALEFTGDPTPIATEVPGGGISWGGAHFGVSESGVLIHLRGALSTSSLLNWRDRKGNLTGSIEEKPDGYWEPTMSNDGTRLAVAIGQDVGDIWIYEIERGTRTRFTFDPADDRSPLWSPDDSRIVFESSRNTSGELYVRPTSGQGEAELLYTFDTQIVPSHWSSDGRYIFLNRLALSETGWDVWTYDIETGEAEPVLDGPFNQMVAALSPDGKWLAFTSNESGTEEIYVQAFPEAKGRWMVSTDGGYESFWRADGKELFFLSASGVSSVSVSAGSTFSFGTPENLFAVNIRSAQRSGFYASPDGQRILLNELPPADASKVGARLMLNWTKALER